MIYLDNCATTPVLPEIAEVVSRYNSQNFFNPSAVYAGAAQVYKDIIDARRTLAAALGCGEKNIIYFSCGTEANNAAIFSALRRRGGRVITTEGEHPSVYAPFTQLASKGYDVKFCRLQKDGTCDREHLLSLVNADTLLVSVLHVNNETGAINDIAGLSAAVKDINPQTAIHSDGVQAFLKIQVNAAQLGVDMYTISGHKAHAPKGISALYSRGALKPFLLGGGQESGVRSGTENVPAIMAFSRAAEMFSGGLQQFAARCRVMRDTAISIIKSGIEGAEINAEHTAVPQILSVSLPKIRSEVMVQMLSERGIYVGSGAACSTKSKASRVIKAMGGRYPEGTLRLSFSRLNTLEETQQACRALIELFSQF